VTLRPNWFLDNLLFGAAEVKAAGQITYPTAGQGISGAFIDTRDIASAAATILMLPGDLLTTFIAARAIEVHGPTLLNLAENVTVLAKAVGYVRLPPLLPRPLAGNGRFVSTWEHLVVAYSLHTTSSAR
jgi:uncharacterized protein YbjT (DUF2867 family)